jgi:uncharacterized protein (DUF983 family)
MARVPGPPDPTSPPPVTPAPGALVPREQPGRLFVRALTKRCPVCGQGHLFRRWFRMIPRCPRCGLVFHRSEGQLSGDIGVNTIVSFGVLLVVLLGGVLLNWPDPPMATIAVVAVAVALIVPLAFLPFSKTVWLAAELLFRPLEPGEVRPGYGPQ